MSTPPSTLSMAPASRVDSMSDLGSRYPRASAYATARSAACSTPGRWGLCRRVYLARVLMVVDMISKLLLEIESLFKDAALLTGPTSVLMVPTVTS